MASVLQTVPKPPHGAGIVHWMHRVEEECRHAALAFAPDPVHDLRVALRRCRSLADGFASVDPHPDWRAMRKAGRKLFRRLGELRDLHVTIEWIEKLAPAGDSVRVRLLPALAAEEEQLKHHARAALEAFDRARWSRWTRTLGARAKRLPPGGPVFKHLALERWMEARALHRRAMRTRSHVGWHRLRIGLKRFRYTVENFLPARAEWLRDLKRLQDVLGEVHDLDVLAGKYFTRSHSFPDSVRTAWLSRIRDEREKRLAEYRAAMSGPASLWGVWRAGLPADAELPAVGLEKLRAWAAFTDPRFPQTLRVARLAIELFDGIASTALPRRAAQRARRILHAAAVLHHVGASHKTRRGHKQSEKMIRQFPSPLGWTRAEMNRVALVARYHRGAEPREAHAAFSRLSASGRQSAALLAGILRLAYALAHPHAGTVRELQAEKGREAFLVRAKGLRETLKTAAWVGGSKHLLEAALRGPVIVRGWTSKKAPGLGLPNPSKRLGRKKPQQNTARR